MELKELSDLAVLVRAYLGKSKVEINHSQSLDTIAAIPGLRNWPEVRSFPQRVAAARLDLTSANRLAYRLEHKHKHSVAATDLLLMLTPQQGAAELPPPEIWPAGPAPGVYLATERSAVDALVEQYADATDGALLYTESAGSNYDGAIDLGDGGLWSSGLARVPSGTLIIVGPLRLDEQSWNDARDRIGMACSTADQSGHRVVVLIESIDMDNVAADACLLASGWVPDTDLDMEIKGWVSKDGNLTPEQVRRAWQRREGSAKSQPTSRLPAEVEELVRPVVESSRGGIMAFGSMLDGDNPGSELAEGVLALTERFGPAARILSRHRSTMEKFDRVPEAVKRLPFLPSVESAYAQGYRRFLVDPNYTTSEVVNKYVGDSIFLTPTYCSDVESVALAALRGHLNTGWDGALELLLAAIAITPIEVGSSRVYLSDVYVRPPLPFTCEKNDNSLFEFPMANRALCQEDQVAALLKDGFELESFDIRGMSERSRNKLLARLSPRA